MKELKSYLVYKGVIQLRIYLIILETMAPMRRIEVLHNTSDGDEALKNLISSSDKWEESIVSGNCRVMMTTYIE